MSEETTAALVAAQAPRLFATVVTKEGADTKIIGWGMDFKDSAYMVSADGKNQYFLADAENALLYVRCSPDAVPDLVWVDQLPEA